MKIITKKKKDQAIQRIIANYIITLDALKKADMTLYEFADAIKHLDNNTIEIIATIGNIKDIEESENLIFNMR